jgi:hypothetical protein
VFGVAIWKYIKMDVMIKTTTNHKTFKKEIAFYESLGFSLTYDKKLFEETTETAGTTYTFESNTLQSFNLEILMTVLMLIVFVYFIRADQRFKFLTNCEN